MNKLENIRKRIAGVLGSENVLTALLDLSPRDLKSLELYIAENQAKKLPLGELLAQHEQNPAFALAFVDPRVSIGFTEAAFAAAPDFTAVELSPVCPLGTTHALAGIHQNNVLSATRNTELLADPTPALALECARRRKVVASRATPIKLCASQRLMRMQPLPIKGLLPHFRLFALTTAGQNSPTFEAENLREHIEVYLRLFRLLTARGYSIKDITVEVSCTEVVKNRLLAAGVDPLAVRRTVRTHHFPDPDELLFRFGISAVRGTASEVLASLPNLPRPLATRLEELETRTLAPLRTAYPEALLRLDLGRLEGLGYYTGTCLRIYARDPNGNRFPLADGGFTRWTQELLSDRRERFLTTGIGQDLLCARFR